jgi:2-desacetyl-2-hydroxyethyl bacteriochlorophyllide A dehydrogenase
VEQQARALFMAKRIIFPEKGKVAFEAFDLPELAAHDVRVLTHYSLMSIGTETIILNQKYDPDTHFARMFSFPQLKTGVQAIGEVEALGKDVDEFEVGDIIFMREAHASHQVLPASECSAVPPDLDLKSICWCGLAKTAFRAAWAGRFELGLDILIIGAGPLGQMAIRWASAAGLETIAVADLSASRLEHAVRGGATLTIEKDIADAIDEIQSINEGRGPSIVVDITGNPLVFRHALAVAAKFGKIIVLGDTGYPSKQCLSSDVMTKGLTIQATHDSHDRDGWTQRRIDQLFFDLVKREKFNLSGLITHEFSPEDCIEAYDLANQNRGETMGILYDWTKSDC